MCVRAYMSWERGGGRPLGAWRQIQGRRRESRALELEQKEQRGHTEVAAQA